MLITFFGCFGNDGIPYAIVSISPAIESVSETKGKRQMSKAEFKRAIKKAKSVRAWVVVYCGEDGEYYQLVKSKLLESVESMSEETVFDAKFENGILYIS